MHCQKNLMQGSELDSEAVFVLDSRSYFIFV